LGFYPQPHCLAICVALAILASFPGTVKAQSAHQLSQIKRICVEKPASDRRATEVHDELVRRLRKSREIQVVSTRTEADAILSFSEQIWATGRVSLNPRSHNTTEALYEGFLSAELIGKDRQVLWSYLVTPSKFAWGGVADDLARQLISKLLSDIRAKSEGSDSALTGSSHAAANLKGAGATFPAPLYQKWFELFESSHAHVHIGYEAVGSGEGIRRLREDQVDFSASEMPLTDQTMSEAHRYFLHLPVVLGAVVPIYHLAGVRERVNFTPEILAEIYLGKIRKWNDAQIRNANPGAHFPDAEITVVHRSDSSGTSFVWSDYLSKVSPEWKTLAGAGTNVQWPIGIGVEYNDGVAATVQRIPNSVGYVEFIYAIQHELRFGAVRNAAGHFVKADLASVTEAARSTATDSDLRVSITDPAGAKAYPIATYTWLLLPAQIEDRNKREVLLDLIRWILTEGQKSCSSLGYAPLPPEVINRELEWLSHADTKSSSKNQDRDSWINLGSTAPSALVGSPNSKYSLR